MTKQIAAPPTTPFPAVSPSGGEAWLSIIPRNARVIASAPLATDPYGASILPTSQYCFDQHLLGFEAQMNAFDHVLRQHGRALDLAPIPEMFVAAPRPGLPNANRFPTAVQLNPSGDRRRMLPSPPTHLRFGPVRSSRVLKGARNIAILADDVVTSPFETLAHPAGSDTSLPAPFEAAFAYGPRRAGPPGFGLGSSRRTRAAALLPNDFLQADADAEALDLPAPPFDANGCWHLFPGLRIRSLAEYRKADWFARAGAKDEHDASDWRRALVLARLAISGDAAGVASGTARGFLLLPWNLSNPASIVPDLVRKLILWERGGCPESRVVLYPFNQTPTTRDKLQDLITDLSQTGVDRHGLRNIFLAKLQTLRHAFRLRQLFPTAWIEGDDPESNWTDRRLSLFGIRTILLDQDMQGSSLPAVSVGCDEKLTIQHVDCFGQRTYSVRTLSVRQLSSLMAQIFEVQGTMQRRLEVP